MSIVRVITEGLDSTEVYERAVAALKDPDVTSIVIHKAGSHLRLPDGKEIIVGLRPSQTDPEPAGIC